MPQQYLSSIVGDCVSSPSCLFNTTILLLCAAAITYAAGLLIYQLYIHPLSKYPGPLPARITPLYDLYHAYVGDKHLLLYHLHQKYGRIVRFTPNTISINDPSALKVIYGHNANAQKSEFYRCFRAAPTAISTLLATEKAHHAKKRRIMGQAFSDQALKGLEKYVLAHVEELVSKIAAQVKRQEYNRKMWSSSLDMQRWCNWLVFDIMGDLVFGKSFGTLGEHPENREGIRLLTRAARRNYSVAAMPWLLHSGWEQWLPPFRKLYQDRSQYLAFGKRQVMSKMERQKNNSPEEAARKDIFNVLLNARDPETGEGVPTQELWMEGNTLIVAGSDTTSTTLSAILFYLLKNPETLTRLESEVRKAFQRREDIRMGAKMHSCIWLRACIDEAMRMSPAVPGLLPREVLKGGLLIPSMELSLPEGVNVGVPIYAIHHHADYVVDPFTYDPSRWLQEGHSQDKELLHAVFNPFSLGHRACLGKPLVYMELSIAVARLVFEFGMRLSRDQHYESFIIREVNDGKRHEDEYQMQDWFLSNNFGPWVEFKTREEKERVDSGVDVLQ